MNKWLPDIEWRLIGMLGLCVFLVLLCTAIFPDARLGRTQSQVPGFVAVTVDDVFDSSWDKDKSDKDLQANYLVNMSHIVAMYPSEHSTKRISRTTAILAWYSEPLTLIGSLSQIEAEMRDTVNEVGGVIGNSPFPRFGDPRDTPKDTGKDKSHPDKLRRAKDK